MKQAMAAWPAPPSPFADSAWFDPLAEAVRGQVRAFIEQLLEEELEAALGRGRDDQGERCSPSRPAPVAGNSTSGAAPSTCSSRT
jgi:hypothetical protein